MDFESAVKFLKFFGSYEDRGFPSYDEKNFNLARLRRFLKEYGVGFEKLRYVHVTGSKGKSSVCGMIGNYLHRKGYGVGVFTSPYVVDITESIWIGGKNISKIKFVERVRALKDFINRYDGEVPTYFELLVAIALKCFVDDGVDFAVMEVGLGGRLDATNVIDAEIAVLTVVEKEHTDILGRTYEKILNEKLGIAVGKNVKNLVSARQSAYVKSIIVRKTAGIKNVVFAGKNRDADKGGRAGGYVNDHECGNVNCAVVFEVLKMLLGTVDLELFDDVVRNFKMIGRFDVRFVNGKSVVFDMAHTGGSVKFLVKNLKRKFPEGNFFFLVSIMKNKNAKNILSPICWVGKKVVVTSCGVARGYSATELKNLATKIGCNVMATEDCQKAFEGLTKEVEAKRDVLVVTGSHFLAGKILERL